jgi:cytochrome c-type biogenesis protein CcmH/NrfG
MRIVIAILAMSVLALGCQSSGERARAARQNSELARQENDRAFKLIEEAKYEEAAKVLHRAIDADVMFGPAHNNMGLVYYYENKLYDAAWEFQNAMRLMPHHPDPRNNLGLVFEKAGKMREAADAYGAARQIEPDNPEYISNLARARVRNGDDDDETRKLLEEVVLKDSRPEWTNWARMNLIRLRQLPSAGAGGAATRGSVSE